MTSSIATALREGIGYFMTEYMRATLGVKRYLSDICGIPENLWRDADEIGYLRLRLAERRSECADGTAFGIELKRGLLAHLSSHITNLR